MSASSWIGYHLLRVRRHFARRLANVFGERRERDRVRRKPCARSAVAIVVMALVTAVAVENLLAVLRGGRLSGQDKRQS